MCEFFFKYFDPQFFLRLISMCLKCFALSKLSTIIFFYVQFEFFMNILHRILAPYKNKECTRQSYTNTTVRTNWGIQNPQLNTSSSFLWKLQNSHLDLTVVQPWIQTPSMVEIMFLLDFKLKWRLKYGAQLFLHLGVTSTYNQLLITVAFKLIETNIFTNENLSLTSSS